MPYFFSSLKSHLNFSSPADQIVLFTQLLIVCPDCRLVSSQSRGQTDSGPALQPS